jgi:hypothetical protein
VNLCDIGAASIIEDNRVKVHGDKLAYRGAPLNYRVLSLLT